MNNQTDTAFVAARWLATHRIVFASDIISLVCILSAGSPIIPLAYILFACTVYLHVRLEFDARIFADFAKGYLKPQDFDTQLAALFRKTAPERTMPQRIQGAFRLYKKLILFSVLMFALALYALFDKV